MAFRDTTLQEALVEDVKRLARQIREREKSQPGFLNKSVVIGEILFVATGSGKFYFVIGEQVLGTILEEGFIQLKNEYQETGLVNTELISVSIPIEELISIFVDFNKWIEME